MCIFAHPKENSFNRAILERVKEELENKNHEVDLWDLYRMGFNPILSQEEIQRGFSLEEGVQKAYKSLEEAEAFIFIHPIWWGSMPAILKGFIDRVFRSGVAYDFIKNERGELEKYLPLKGKKAFVIMTTDSPEKSISSHELVWKEGVGNFCEIDFYFKTFWSLFFSQYQERIDFLESLGLFLEELS